MSNEDFLPQDYEVPKSPSRYTKFVKDETVHLRILAQEWDKMTQIYWEYYDTRWEKVKPVRSFEKFEETPWIKVWEYQKENWSIKVWNYDEELIQIMSIPQKSIKEAIIAYYQEDAYWAPTKYDLKISRKWDKLLTTYKVVALPPKDFDEKLLEGKEIIIDWAWFMDSETEIFKNIEA